MSYPGNQSLSTAVKDRVVSTFRQAVGLYKQGRNDDVAAGCNLILQMDPTFDPARKLLDKSRNPSLPIDVDALLPEGNGGGGLAEARSAMAARDFERVVHITTEILTDDLMNDEARILSEEAREKMEASPFVEQFARKCEQQIASGNLTGARADLEKARALDPTHPAVVRVAQTIAAKEAAPSAPREASGSFIVDDKAQAGGRGTAAASDFGFTFEEDKPQQVTSFEGFSFDTPANAPGAAGFGGFSFDSPSAAPAAPAGPAGGGFDFATASIATSPDDQKKIDQYLADGDRALSAGDYQQAIDLWSRIFLIDVTNDQASDRIEQAKAKRRELEQKVEPLLASGTSAFERKDVDRARADFSEALRLDPNNPTARDYLDRLASGAAAPAVAAAPVYAPSEPSANKLDIDFFGEEPSGSYETPLIPPDPGAPAPEAKPTKKSGAVTGSTRKASAGRKLPVGLIAAVLAVVLLAAGGWFVWTRFMNKPEADPAATQAVFARASSLADRGKYDQAITLLQDIQPGDPQHDKALVMIADLQQKKSKSAQMIDGVPAAEFYDQKIAAAQLAASTHDYTAAKRAFEDAMRVKPLSPELKPLYDNVNQQVSKLDAAKTLFAERRYADALASLQPLLDADPQNKNIQRMIVDAHFNLGAAALQEAAGKQARRESDELLNNAIREFDEVLKVDPNDELARRSRDLAARYQGQDPDLLYKIYVKYLPLRQVN